MTFLNVHKRAFNGKLLEPFPTEVLKRVDRPTTFIDESKVQRVHEKDGGFNKARNGDYGPKYQGKLGKFKYPISRINSSFKHTVYKKKMGLYRLVI